MVDWNNYKPLFILVLHTLVAVGTMLFFLNPSTVLEFVGVVTIIAISIYISLKIHGYVKFKLGEKGLSKEIDINKKYITITFKDRMLWIDFGDKFIHLYKVDDSKFGFMKQDDNGDFITYKVFGDGKDYASYNYVSSLKDS